MDGNIINIFKTKEMVSHIGWRNSNSVVAYCSTKNFGDNYVIFEIEYPEKSQEIGDGKLSSDGHPSFDHSGRWMLTDTYPDRSRMRHLIMYDIKNNRVITLGSFFSPWQFNKVERCDLHPRISPDNRYVSIDSSHTGFRKSYILDIRAILTEAE